MATKKVILPGSDRHPIGNRVGAQPGDEVIEVSVILKPKVRAKASPDETPLSREEFAKQYGADPALLKKLEAFAKEHGLTVGEVSPARRTVKLEGTAANLQTAFGVQLAQYEYEGHHYRARSNPIQLPEDLADSIEAI